MRFKSFEIVNFKGIKNAKLTLGSGSSAIHTLVGLNESGKTTILEAINMFQPDEEGMHAIAQQSTMAIGNEQLIPKSRKGDFSEDIKITANISISEKDREAVIELCNSEFGLQCNPKSIPTDFTITKVLEYDNSKYTGQTIYWNIHPELKTKRQKKFKVFNSSEEQWQAIVKLLKSRLPRIIYFPNFLFDFPDRILVSGKLTDAPENEIKTNEYFVGIIEDALASLKPPLELNKHIVHRVTKTNTDDPFAKFMQFWFGSSESESVDDVLERLARKISEEVFGRWQEILGKDIGNAEIEVTANIEANPDTNEREVYLTFRVKQGRAKYRVSERSLGFRWFFCFLLFTRFSRGSFEDHSMVFLFDEPASNLHSNAQAKLLDSFEVLSAQKNNIIFSTHSHHLINPLWLENAQVVSNGLEMENELNGEFVPANQEINISITPYKKFVGENKEKSHYFQPILDSLNYVPSPLEAKDISVLVEGKSDFYMLNWYKRHHFSDCGLNFLPINGVSNAASVISLLLGWTQNFVMLCDSDKEGQTAKARYLSELPIQSSCFIDYSEIFGVEKNAPRQIEGLLSTSLKADIAAHYHSKRCTKNQIQRYFSEALSGGNDIQLDEETNDNFKLLFSHLFNQLSENN